MNKQWFWLAFISCGLVIAYLSLSPSAGGSLQFWDKAQHAAAYLAFTLSGAPLVLRANTIVTAWLWRLLIFVFIYGIAMEVGQHFVPGRDMSLLDVVANTVGIAIGGVLVMFGLIKVPKAFLR